jgi:hypothetical protein
MSDNDRKREIAESFAKQISKIDQENERAFITGVLEAVQTPPKKIPEPVFREIFMPYLVGDKVPSAENDVLAHWVGLVGSGTDPADIVNTKGETLFQVPPVYDTSDLSTVRSEKGMGFATIFEHYQEQSKVHGMLGKRFLVEELSNKAAANIPEGSLEGHGWLPALKYYGLIKPTDTPTLLSTKHLPGDDDLDFEDSAS